MLPITSKNRAKYIKFGNLTTDLMNKHGLFVSNLYFVRVGLYFSVIKGINTAGQALHPPPAAASAASRGVLNPSLPHSLDHARASTVAISLRSSINLKTRSPAQQLPGAKKITFIQKCMFRKKTYICVGKFCGYAYRVTTYAIYGVSAIPI
jgi:hypothetical protein